MDKRYSDPRIEVKWSKPYKASKWDAVELAVIQARVNLHRVVAESLVAIRKSLFRKPIDIAQWEKREAETNHDYDSYCDVRKWLMPEELRHLWHEDLTTYDGQDPAFVIILHECVRIVKQDIKKLFKVLEDMARRYRYCLMMGKTHRQAAELQSFGKRCLTWLVQLRISYNELLKAERNLRFGKLAGPVGNYGQLDPELEKEACKILHLKVLYGVTQIIPRELLVPIANALSQMVKTMNKIANDICEGTSGSYPIWHVPFPKKGKGSSAMAWKRNPWRAEGIKGMADMAKGRSDAIGNTILTAFERDIGQSCVERNEWGDLFHIVIYSIKTLAGVLEKLEVYPDNMAREIDEAHGTYAGLAARDFVIKIGFDDQEAYRIIQLASWMTLKPTSVGEQMRKGISSPEAVIEFFAALRKERQEAKASSIQEIIADHRLEHIPSLEPTQEQVVQWNQKLYQAFSSEEVGAAWMKIFNSAFTRVLENEKVLYREILDETV